jgi:hypothetical protein
MKSGQKKKKLKIKETAKTSRRGSYTAHVYLLRGE